MESDRGSTAINRFCNFPVLDFDSKMSVIHRNNKISGSVQVDTEEPSHTVIHYFNGKGHTAMINPLVRAIQLQAHKVMIRLYYILSL